MKILKSKTLVGIICLALVMVIGVTSIKSHAADYKTYKTSEKSTFNKRIFLGGGWGKTFTATYTGNAELSFTVKKCKKVKSLTGGDGTDYQAFVYQLCKDINGDYYVVDYEQFKRSTTEDKKVKVKFAQHKFDEYIYCISSQKLETESDGFVSSWKIDECKPAYVISKGMTLKY